MDDRSWEKQKPRLSQGRGCIDFKLQKPEERRRGRLRFAAAADEAEAADHDAEDAADDEPETLVGGRASDAFLDVGSNGVAGADSVDEKDDTDDEDGDGDGLIHGIWFVGFS